MIRDALKEALVDLRAQLRGRKASAYVLKIEEEHEKDDKKPSRKDEDDKDKREPKRSGASATSEAVSEGMSELREQMKSFMTGSKNKGSGGRPITPLPIGPGSKPVKASKAPEPDAKGKGKTK